MNSVGKLKLPITDTGDERVVSTAAQSKDLPMKLKFFFIALLVWMPIAPLFTFQSAHAQAAPRRIEVTAKKFDFTPAEITVKKGEPVVIVLKSADVAHGLSFPDLGVKAKVSKGQTAEACFYANEDRRFCRSVLSLLWSRPQQDEAYSPRRGLTMPVLRA